MNIIVSLSICNIWTYAENCVLVHVQSQLIVWFYVFVVIVFVFLCSDGFIWFLWSNGFVWTK